MSLRFALLAMLCKEPNTGYGIGRLLHSQLDHLWDARLQQIYSELAKLEALGLIEAESIDLPNRPAKKIYELTPAGNKALDRWLEQPPAPLSSKNDLLVKLYCLERLPNDVIIRSLEERKAEYEAMTRELRDRLTHGRRTDSDQLGYLLTLEAALSEAEGQAAWCDRAVSIVQKRSALVSLPQERAASSQQQATAHAAGA
jgi:DNA-binding PadR family transcriptional regulator